MSGRFGFFVAFRATRRPGRNPQGEHAAAPMDIARRATTLNGYTIAAKENEHEPPIVVPSCCGVPKRATDLCDHFRIRPPIDTYDGD